VRPERAVRFNLAVVARTCATRPTPQQQFSGVGRRTSHCQSVNAVIRRAPVDDVMRTTRAGVDDVTPCVIACVVVMMLAEMTMTPTVAIDWL